MGDEIANIDKVVASVCKGEDKKSDAMMLMAPDCNWDQFLCPAPSAIAILGELLLISADTDFSLAEKPPKDGFTFLLYPESFRASIVQVTHAGWTAFNEAHTNMDQIRLLSGDVDQHVKDSVKFLLQGTQAEIQKMLPTSLTKVQDIADKSLGLATKIEDQFVKVMQLTGELLEACTMTRGVHEEKLKETQIAIRVAKTQEKAKLAEKEEAINRFEEMEKEVKEAQDEFKDAIKSLPSGMNSVCLALCEGVVDGIRNVTGIPGLVNNTVNKAIHSFVDVGGHDDDDDEDDAYEKQQKQKKKRKIYTVISSVQVHINELFGVATGKTGKENEPCPDWEIISNGELGYVQQSIQACSDNIARLSVMHSKLSNRVVELCKGARQICNTLESIAKSMATEDREQKISDAIANTRKVQKEAEKLATMASKKLGKNPLDNKSPYLSKMLTQSSSSSLLKAETENARYKTELAKETLKDAKRRKEESAKELKEANRELEVVLAEMKKLKVKEVDFDTIRKTLIQGIKALAKVREQWGKLVRFFQMLSNLIKCCLHTSLTNFVDQAKKGRELKMDDPSTAFSDVYKDIIFVQASKASQVAHVVRAISGTYVKISNEHLMDRITCLGHLVALDSKTDAATILQRREELHDGCKKAHEDILMIVEQEKTEFNKKVDERILKIAEMQKKLPAIEPEREKEIKQSVSEGFEEDEIDDLI